MTRVLHVLGAMHYGGVENWLMNVLRKINREKFKLEFLVHTQKPAVHDKEILELGSRLHYCGHPSNPLLYGHRLKSFLKRERFDVIHGHVHHYTGLILRWAAQAGVKQRIAHSHSDTSSLDQKAGMLRRAYLSTTERLVYKHATQGLAGTRSAAAALYGPLWESDKRWTVIGYAIDFRTLKPVRDVMDIGNIRDFRHRVREELHIPNGAFVIGHVGRFAEVKNHAFFVEVIASLVRCGMNVFAVLMGDGPLRPLIEEKVAALGLKDRFIFTGPNVDVHRVLAGALDLFLFPSLYEGLPISLVEAQAAGLRCLVSDTVSDEAYRIMRLISKMSLKLGPAEWARRIREIAASPPPMTWNDAFSLMMGSSFNIETGVRLLEHLYSHGNLGAFGRELA